MNLLDLSDELILAIMRSVSCPHIGMVNKRLMSIWKQECIQIPSSVLVAPILTHIRHPVMIKTYVDLQLKELMKEALDVHVPMFTARSMLKDNLSLGMKLASYLIDVVSVYACISGCYRSNEMSFVDFTDVRKMFTFEKCLNRSSYAPPLVRNAVIASVVHGIREKVMKRNEIGQLVFGKSAREGRIRENVRSHALWNPSNYIGNFKRALWGMYPALAWNVSIILVIDGAIQFKKLRGVTLFDISKLKSWLMTGLVKDKLTEEQRVHMIRVKCEIEKIMVTDAVSSPFGQAPRYFRISCKRLLEYLFYFDAAIYEYNPAFCRFDIGELHAPIPI